MKEVPLCYICNYIVSILNFCTRLIWLDAPFSLSGILTLFYLLTCTQMFSFCQFMVCWVVTSKLGWILKSVGGGVGHACLKSLMLLKFHYEILRDPLGRGLNFLIVLTILCLFLFEHDSYGCKSPLFYILNTYILSEVFTIKLLLMTRS